MALQIASYTDPQTSQVVVSGEAGSRVRVTRVVASFEAAGTLRLLRSPGEAGESSLLPALHVANSGTVGLELGADGGVATGVGEALGVTTSLAPGKLNSLMIWYERVA